jgi:hypothetical protein
MVDYELFTCMGFFRIPKRWKGHCFFPTRTSSELAEQRRDAERSHEAGKLKDDVDSPGGREIS